MSTPSSNPKSSGPGSTPCEAGQLEKRKRDRLRELLLQKVASSESNQKSNVGVLANSDSFEPFPLTETQQAYWIGQSIPQGLGGVATHVYCEMDCQSLDFDRLSDAMKKLLERHAMLRADILPDGRQRILNECPMFSIPFEDLSGQPEELRCSRLEEIRSRMSHQVRHHWPFCEVVGVRTSEQITRLFFSFNLLVIDAFSVGLLLVELQLIYKNPGIVLPPITGSYRDFVLETQAAKATDSYRRSMDFWREQLGKIEPAPELPMFRSTHEVTPPRFRRLEETLSAAEWASFRSRCQELGLTPTAALLAAFTSVLTRWSRTNSYSVMTTLFNRQSLQPELQPVLGDFTSLMLLSVEDEEIKSETFATRALRLQSSFWERFDHSRVNGVDVLRELKRERGIDPLNVISVVFTSILGDIPARKAEPLGKVVYRCSQTPNIWLDHQVFEEQDALTLSWDYVDLLFPDGLIEDMFACYFKLLKRLAFNEAAWNDPALLPLPSDQVVRRAMINQTRVEMTDTDLLSLFLSQVETRPNEVAVIAEDGSLTYAELNERAKQLASRIALTLGDNRKPIAILLPKSLDQIAAAIAVLKTGAPFLPIDICTPPQRLAMILEQSEVVLQVVDPTNNLCCMNALVPSLSVIAPSDAESQADVVLSRPTSDDLAYIIYTSGSTGKPKGVAVTHRAACNTILDINRQFAMGPSDRVFAISSLAFDLSIFDIFGTFAAGGIAVLPAEGTDRDPKHWIECIVKHRVTVWNSVPALAQMLVEYLEGPNVVRLMSLRLMLLSGDWIHVSLPDRIWSTIPSVRLVSLGGATEAGIWSIVHPVDRLAPHAKRIPYGRPLANQRWYVLDEEFHSIPDWVNGSLYISGDSLAVGYHRNHEQTELMFVTHPETGERLYRTGDVGRYLPNGEIEILGREDAQVKINGVRIEPGEIEATLIATGMISAVAVVPFDVRDSTRLVAFVVAIDGQTSQEIEVALLQAQRDWLPVAMHVSRIVFLNSLPLSSNGKIDRSAFENPLPTSNPSELSGDKNSSSAEVDKGADLAEKIGRLIGETLGLPAIGPNDNLLDLGADSIEIVRVAMRIEEECGIRVSFPELFQSPTISSIVATSSNGSSSGSRAARTFFNDRAILDPTERDQFKKARYNLRNITGRDNCLTLPSFTDFEDAKDLFARQSNRFFDEGPLTLDRMSGILHALSETTRNGIHKRAYASAGGLYPVQTYLYVKPNAIESLTDGCYYYDPVCHRLVVERLGEVLDEQFFDSQVNRPLFRRSHFTLLFVSDDAAIEPMYGDLSSKFVDIEVGAICQLLESTAPRFGIGLCQIGWWNIKYAIETLGLTTERRLVHAAVGGPITASRIDCEGTDMQWESGVIE
ncbi:non-ribosomal peptide synthetase [Bremerella cremea]|uniref:Non-ribosomal peptide synthetase n=1 Tax=Blastopirellula marina TaxID=124 RepID=A0A2S8G0L2_9BACT|nr:MULTISPECIES: non-ribosomal peptide synthetase [Pirellulaceae]PQO37850.1 non-ribosomal peptide synthetase [Blastopirellula marina]RCS50238.1 non-ribosomal peptide synthetase [Bremerella cremea]